MAFHYSPKIVNDGLILYLDAANTKSFLVGSATWSDLSRNQLSASLLSGATFSSSNGGCITFDGVDDYGIISNNSNLIFGSGDFTINLWMLFPISSTGEATGWGPIISKGCNTSAQAGSWWVAQTGLLTSSVTLNISSTVGGTFVTSLASGALSNGWHNICFTRSGSTAYSYVDGKSISSDGTSNSDLTSPSPLTLCSTYITALSPKRTNTSLSCINLYNKALSNSEVLQNFKALKSRFGL